NPEAMASASNASRSKEFEDRRGRVEDRNLLTPLPLFRILHSEFHILSSQSFALRLGLFIVRRRRLPPKDPVVVRRRASRERLLPALLAVELQRQRPGGHAGGSIAPFRLRRFALVHFDHEQGRRPVGGEQGPVDKTRVSIGIAPQRL